MNSHPILNGVRKLDPHGGLPGTALILEQGGFALLGSKDDVLAAGIERGKGRALAMGHDSYFSREGLNVADNKRFLNQALRWLGRDKVKLAMLGFSTDEAALRELGFTLTSPAECDVLWITQSVLDNDLKRADSLAGWVQRGGGLLVSGPVWGWLQLNPGKSLAKDHSGNRALTPLGLALTDGTCDESVPIEADRGNAALAFATMLAGAPNASASLPLVEKALAILPERHSLAQAIGRRVASEPPPTPTRERPLGLDKPFARLRARLDSLNPMPGRAHPASASFPGEIPATAPRRTKTITLPRGVPQWHSTGLYAAPGQVITVSAPADARLSLRIGAHSDTLWHLNKWERFPEVTDEWPLRGGELKVSSPFGGAIFLVAPGRGVGREVTATVAGAVEAPLFVRGKTSAAEWETSRATPGPWAELVGQKVVLTVPSAVVRDLNNPDDLMTYWDEVMDHCYAFYAAPLRNRQERYCVDRQISAGYMHSGYPIMTGDDVAKKFVSVDILRGDDGNTCWGFYHEMGHNFQEPEWTWNGCGEVTNNLFSLYGSEKMNRAYDEKTRSYPHAHPAIRTDGLERTVGKYIAEGAVYSRWQSDPWIALSTFIDLRKEFGWEPFTKVFAEYQALPEAQKPRSDNDRHDGFVVRFSQKVGKNIRPHFMRYGIPTTDEGCRAVKNLPDWTAR
ncbi:MAG: M60 family metallopeptidase [Armatimonas sp.]